MNLQTEPQPLNPNRLAAERAREVFRGAVRQLATTLPTEAAAGQSGDSRDLVAHGAFTNGRENIYLSITHLGSLNGLRPALEDLREEDILYSVEVFHPSGKLIEAATVGGAKESDVFVTKGGGFHKGSDGQPFQMTHEFELTTPRAVNDYLTLFAGRYDFRNLPEAA